MDEQLAPPLAQLTPVNQLPVVPAPETLVAPPPPAAPMQPETMAPAAPELPLTPPSATIPLQPATPPTSSRAKFILLLFVIIAGLLAYYVFMPAKVSVTQAPTPTAEPVVETETTSSESASANAVPTPQPNLACQNVYLGVGIQKLPNDWTCEENTLSAETGEGYLFLSAGTMGITISNSVGDTAGCREGYHAFCTSEKFFSNSFLQTTLYSLSGVNKDISGPINHKAISSNGEVSSSPTIIVVDHDGNTNFTDQEKTVVQDILKQVVILQK